MIEPRLDDDVADDVADADERLNPSLSRPTDRPPALIGPGPDRAIAIAITAVVLAPLVAAVVTRVGRPYLPVQDYAVIDLRVRDVLSRDIPLVGPYSRYGWDHPGPLVYWLVAPFAALFGSPAWATQVGFVLLDAAAVVWTAVLTWRRRGLWSVALWMAVLAASFGVLGSSAVLSPWGPNVALAWFVLFACQVWLIAGDDVWVLPQAAAVGTFLVQTHVGYAPLVVAGAAFVAPAVWRAAGRRWRGVVRLRWVRWSAVVGVVLWLPALVETITDPPGNLVRVADKTLLHPASPKIGLGTALGVLAAPFRPRPSWLGGTTPFDQLQLTAVAVGAAWLVVPVAVIVGAGWLAHRAGDRDGRRLMALAGVLLAAGLLALVGVQGAPFTYLFYWREALAALIGFGAVTVVIRWAARTRPRLALAIPILGGLVVLAASVPLARQVATAPIELDQYGPVTQDLLDQLEATGQPTAPVLLRAAGTTLGGVHGGVLDELDRRGAPVRVDGGQPFQYGHHRIATPADVDAIWYVAEESDAVAQLSAIPGASVVAQHHALAPADADRLASLQRRVASQLDAAGRADLVPQLASPLVGFALVDVPGIDPADLDELGRLNQRVVDGVCECAVIAVPTDYDGPVPAPTQ
jgi:hypothetical protein